MIDKKISRPRGRPRAFDKDAAIATAQAMFHEQGYEAVSVAALTEALGINPPSFYAAFGSKAELFGKVLERYSAGALPMDELLASGRDPAEALGDLLHTAARIYAADSRASGCMVLEASRGTACQGGDLAQPLKLASRDRVRDFIAEQWPDRADAAADYVLVVMSGLSAGAREGWSEARLSASAAMAADALRKALS